jgi:pimeloyl-ACP methyl ester carboxylesterase
VKFLVAGGISAIIRRSWVAAQARTIVTVSTALEIPLLAGLVGLLTGEPRTAEGYLAGVETTTLERSGAGRRPAIVFVNGATPLGRNEPGVTRLTEGLARAGYRVYVPELVDLREGRISARTVSSIVRLALAAAKDPDTSRGRVGLVGVSVGATLALLAAQRSELGGRLTVVAGLAPYTDARNAIRLATTGTYWNGHESTPYASRPYLTLIMARSLADQLSGGDRESFLCELPSIEDYHPPEDEAPDPLASLRERPKSDFTPKALPLIELLTNRDLRRFDRLYERLSPEIRADLERLSPVAGVRRIRVPVELVTGPDDEYFPAFESRRYARLAASARATVTPALSHAGAKISPRELRGLLRFNGFVVRILRAAG